MSQHCWNTAYKQTDFILTANLMYWNWDPQDYIDRRTYRSLKRAWIGFKIAKKDGDHDKMKYYADGMYMHPPPLITNYHG